MTVDQTYIRELLEAVKATTREEFMAACKPDICAGYSAEVAEAWRIREAHVKEVKRRGYE